MVYVVVLVAVVSVFVIDVVIVFVLGVKVVGSDMGSGVCVLR